jgi:MFS family permease
VSQATHQPESIRALLKQRNYVCFWLARLGGGLGNSIQTVAMGWQVYEIARATHNVAQSSLYLGWVGLCTFFPRFLLALTAGEIADRHDRKCVLIVCTAAEIGIVAFLAVATFMRFAGIPLLLITAVGFGVTRAFRAPAATALGPMLVPRTLLPRAIAWNSLAGQSATIIGPSIGGLLVAVSTGFAYSATVCFDCLGLLMFFLITAQTKPVQRPGSRIALIKEGLGYVWQNKIVFGAMSLDLFAVLLGGVTALLPVFARDVLMVGPRGFGILRSSTAIGAGAVAFFLAGRPIRTKAGQRIFIGVALYGVATLVFAFSRHLWLSVAALAVVGAADMMSVYVRQTLVQLVTPDPMRGRVAAVSSLFISGSNELGEFESGVTARLLGPIGAAVFGGAGSLIVTGTWAKLFPALRKADRLE